MSEIVRKINGAPKAPGCYLFYDKQGRVIYAGKAKSIAARARQYFQASSLEDRRVERLLPHIADVSFVVTGTERDALLTEYFLIKEHRPWFNRQLMQDAAYGYLRIDTAHRYPALRVTREKGEDGAEYYGPFRDEHRAYDKLALLHRAFRTPLCQKEPLPDKPCLYYGMGRCLGPCGRHVEEGIYRRAINEIRLLLQGGEPPYLAALAEEINGLARALAFEQAQEKKTLLEALKGLAAACARRWRPGSDEPYYVLFRAYNEQGFSLYFGKGQSICRRADADRIDPWSKAETDALQAGATVVAEGGRLYGALDEVYADKVFLPAPCGSGAGQEGAVPHEAIMAFLSKTGQSANG